MKNSNVKAVIFDMDGVLIDSEPLWKEAEKIVFAPLGIQMTTEMCNLTMGYRTSEVVAYWYERRPWSGKNQETVAIEFVDQAKKLIEEKGRMMQGVLQTLTMLKELDLKIALASSSPMKIINAVIDKLYIKQYFDVIQSAEFEAYGKPHPAVFLSAAKNLNVDPTHCVVIEDSINGVIAAKAARMKVIAIPDPGMIHNAQFCIADATFNSMLELDVNSFTSSM